MLVRKQSLLTKRWNTMEIPATVEEIDAWRNGGKLIQDAFPHFTPDQREFLLSGATNEEWEAAFMPDRENAAAMDRAIEAIAPTRVRSPK